MIYWHDINKFVPGRFFTAETLGFTRIDLVLQNHSDYTEWSLLPLEQHLVYRQQCCVEPWFSTGHWSNLVFGILTTAAPDENTKLLPEYFVHWHSCIISLTCCRLHLMFKYTHSKMILMRTLLWWIIFISTELLYDFIVIDFIWCLHHIKIFFLIHNFNLCYSKRRYPKISEMYC